MEDKIIFKDFKIDFQKLLQLGFVKESDFYKYETKIMNNQFSLVIKIDMNNIVSSDVIEISTGEKFMLYYVTSAIGDFIGKMREEYNNIIEKLKILVVLKISLKANMLT